MGTKTVKCQSTCKLLGMQASSVQQSSGQLEPAMWKPPQGESTVHGILNLGRHEHLLRLGRYNLQHKNKTKRQNVLSRLKYHPKSTQSTLSSHKVLTTGDAIRHPSQSQIGGWVERTWDTNFKILLSIFSAAAFKNKF